MKFFANLLKKTKSIGCLWPKFVRIEIRQEDGTLILSSYENVENLEELYKKAEELLEDGKLCALTDEVFWRYEEI